MPLHLKATRLLWLYNIYGAMDLDVLYGSKAVRTAFCRAVRTRSQP